MLRLPLSKPPPRVTNRLIGSDVKVTPPLSVARAVKLWPPKAALVHVKGLRLLVTWPSLVAPSKNSILLIVPSLSHVFALIEKNPEASTDEFCDGLLTTATGGKLPVPLSSRSKLKSLLPAFA